MNQVFLNNLAVVKDNVSATFSMNVIILVLVVIIIALIISTMFYNRK